MKDIYLRLVWIMMAISGVVFFEPAPMDFLFVIVLIIGLSLKLLKLPRYNDIVLGCIYILIIANIISFFFVSSTIVAFRYFLITIYLILSFLFFIAFSFTYKKDGLKVLFSGYIFSATISACVGILGYLSLIPTFDQIVKFGRVTGFFKDPNVFGPFMVPVILYSLLQILSSDKKLRWYFIFLTCTIANILSYSRAAWINLVLSISILLFFKYFRNPNVKQIFRLIPLLIVFSIGIYKFITIPEVSSMLEKRFAIHAYDADRFNTQDRALIDIVKFPFGIGPGQTELFLNYATHNGYLRVWLENGHAGFLSFLLLIVFSVFTSFRKALSKYNTELYILAFSSLCGILVNGFVIDIVHWRHFWFLLALPLMLKVADIGCDKGL